MYGRIGYFCLDVLFNYDRDIEGFWNPPQVHFKELYAEYQRDQASYSAGNEAKKAEWMDVKQKYAAKILAIVDKDKKPIESEHNR